MNRCFVILLACLFAVPAASQDVPVAPEIEARARIVGKQLRCVVCQNQSIEESDAALAADMRRVVRERLAEGATEEEVVAMMAERYGDFVLLNPPVQANTLLLWFGPLGLSAGALLAFLALRRRRELDEPEPLSADEVAAMRALRDRAR